jgi:hypothetical protein
VTAGRKESVREHWPGVLLVVTSPGQAMVGVVLVAEELTVTVKLHEFVLPDASFAMQVTNVAPRGNAEPDGGAQVAEAPGQLSLTKGAG